MFGRSKDVRPVDQLVILSTDGTADFADVMEITEECIRASSPEHDYSIPVGDVRQFVGGPTGRTLVYAATLDNVQDTKRLAELEKSIVLRHITQYTKPEMLKKTISIREIMAYVGVAILLLAVVFK